MTAFRAPSSEEFKKMRPFAKPFAEPKLMQPKDKIKEGNKTVNLPIRGK